MIPRSLQVAAVVLLSVEAAVAADPPAPAPADKIESVRLEAGWRLSTLPERDKARQWVRDYLDHDLDVLAKRERPVLTAFVPVVVGDTVLFRTYDRVFATGLDGQRGDPLRWWSVGDGGADACIQDLFRKPVLETWRPFYQKMGPTGVLFENSNAGTLSSDGKTVYAVDDLFLPPHPDYLRQFKGILPNFGTLQELVVGNGLKGYGLHSGKLLWELGNPRNDVGPLKGSLFLAPALPVGGRAYVVYEQDQKLNVACLSDQAGGERPLPPTVLWTTTLMDAPDRACFNLSTRRLNAARLAFAGNHLICVTNAGQLVAVDTDSHKVSWRHIYREAKQAPPKEVEWKSSPPLVRDGKVVFTAADAPELYCVRLSDGKPLWKAERGDDLYLAEVYDGKVILVGARGCRALSLADGKEVWKREAGVPSGQGICSGPLYYLPLRTGAESKRPEIAVLDLGTGKVVGRFEPADGDVPGNLAFARCGLVSQTALLVTLYPRLPLQIRSLGRDLKPAELALLWADLLDPEVRRWTGASRLLVAVPGQSVPYFKARLKAVPAPDQARIDRMVADLGSKEFKVRQDATDELEKLADLAVPTLEKALAAKPPLETTQRLEGLLTRERFRALTPEQARVLRAIAVLEEAGTAEARQVLETLAGGAPAARLTREARAVLERLAKREGEAKP